MPLLPPERGLRARRLARLACGVAAILATGIAAGLWLRARSTEALPLYWPLPAFSLTDQDGRTVRSVDLAGAPWIADFIFTRCAGVCPRMTARVAALQRQLPEGGRLVSITVDPTHDTPEVLRRYARDFNAGPGWLFLTGPQSELYQLAVDGFKLEAMEVPPDQQQAGGDGPFLHSSKLVLVDAAGRVRGYYDSTDEEAMSRLAADFSLLRRKRS